MSFRDKLRATEPNKKTSTRRDGSDRSIEGDAGERLILNHLQGLVVSACLHESILVKFPDGSKDRRWRAAITNAEEGDIEILRRNKGGWYRVRTLEVKTSATYPNVTITNYELENSRADYLVCLTNPHGVWATTMEQARIKATRQEGPLGPFHLVRYTDVEKVDLMRLLDDEELYPQLHDCDRMPF